jgi:hypothetical protein
MCSIQLPRALCVHRDSRRRERVAVSKAVELKAERRVESIHSLRLFFGELKHADISCRVHEVSVPPRLVHESLPGVQSNAIPA